VSEYCPGTLNEYVAVALVVVLVSETSAPPEEVMLGEPAVYPAALGNAE
jgi:hypothetical protein